MHITEKGQVTIPADIRAAFGFLPHTEVEFCVRDNQVLLQKKTGWIKKESPFHALYGKATVHLTTDEIMALTRGEE